MMEITMATMGRLMKNLDISIQSVDGSSVNFVFVLSGSADFRFSASLRLVRTKNRRVLRQPCADLPSQKLEVEASSEGAT